jgi:uncharacterized membrane protein YsdA (DUF1294 family)
VKPKPVTTTGNGLLVAFSAIAVGFIIAVYRHWLPIDVTFGILGVYALCSPVTFAVYQWDKRRAMTHGYRVSEKTLHLLEFFGGWPAALVAQRVLHHKNRKVPYQLVFWSLVGLHGLFWLRAWWYPRLFG